MLKTKKLLLISTIMGSIILFISAISIGFHVTGRDNHNGELTFKTHGMTTAQNSYENQNLTPLINNTIIQIQQQSYNQETIDKLRKIKEIKDVYVYVVANTKKGDFIGINPTKDILIPTNHTLIAPQVIEGRLLSKDDTNENTMMVGLKFAKNNYTEDGYAILGRLGYHPKPFQLEGIDMQVVGVVSGDSSIENTVILPFNIVDKMFQEKDKKYELYVTLVSEEYLDKTLQELERLGIDFIKIEKSTK